MRTYSFAIEVEKILASSIYKTYRFKVQLFFLIHKFDQIENVEVILKYYTNN